MKRIITLLLSVLLISSITTPTFASLKATECIYEGMTYKLVDDTVTITGYTEDLPSNPEIPEQIEGKNVTAIDAFAFENAGMETITIPKTVTSIGDGVFYGCDSLQLIYVDSLNEVYEEAGTYLQTKGRKTIIIYLPNDQAPMMMTSQTYLIENIGYGAFKGCRIGTFTIPNIKYISSHAFTGASIDSIHIPSVKEIRESAFANSVFGKVYLKDVETISAKAFEKASGDIYFYGDAPEIAPDAFMDSNVRIHYSTEASGWDNLSIANTEISSFEPVVHKLSFVQMFEGRDEQESTSFADVDVYDGLPLTTEQIPEFPAGEDFEPIFCEISSNEPVYENLTLSVYYRDVSFKTIKFVDGFTNEVFEEVSLRRYTMMYSSEFPTPPEHEGYEPFLWKWIDKTGAFERMISEDDGKWQFEILGDATVVTEYREETFAIYFKDGLTGESLGKMTFELDKIGTILNPDDFPLPLPHEGYIFIGWDYDGRPITPDLVITALFKKADGYPADVNGDGTINAGDAVLALRFAAGLTNLNDEQMRAGDVNNDGTINVGDAVLILRYAAGLIDEF